MTARTLRDPVHGDIEISDEELSLIDTTEFQRLRGIKQLGTASLVFPGAVHTRFEHAIGTMECAARMLDAADRHAARDPEQCLPISDEARRIVRIAALLHDITHIPFGHNLEDQTGLLERHDRPERFARVLGETEIGERLAALGIRDQVLAVLTGSEDVPPFWHQVMSDTIDADLLDYLRRDAFFTGLALRYDDRVRAWFRVDRSSKRMFVDCEKGGMLREDIASELLRLLEIRFHFSERVYYHHAKIAAGALIARMVEFALLGGALTAEGLQRATDTTLIADLERVQLDDADEQGRLERGLLRFGRRELPKRICVLSAVDNEGVQERLIDRFFKPGDPGPRREYERAVEAEARRVLGRDIDVLLYCPARRMQLKESRTLVRVPTVDGAELGPLDRFAHRFPRLGDLAAAYPRLWKLYVLSSERDRDARRKLQEIAMAHLPDGCVNGLRI